MSVHDETNLETSDVPPVIPRRSWSYLFKRLLACNPFYLISAALLLFGMHLISSEPPALMDETSAETRQLALNFGSLQAYEIAIVITAIFLARRRIWYDSMLLTALENMLLLAPFILISQAALIEMRAVWIMCFAGGVVAVLRFAALRRFIPQLNLPNQLLGIGAIMLAVNLSLPVIYRHLHEDKFGTKLASGEAYLMNESAWLLILPAAFALLNFLPHAREKGFLLPQRRWLPAGLFSLWAIVTGIHLYCLGYVYDFDLRPDLIAPALWIASWTVYRRIFDVLDFESVACRNALLIPPMLAVLVAAMSLPSPVCLALAGLNVVCYTAIALKNRTLSIAPHLAFGSVALIIAGMPAELIEQLNPALARPHCLVAAAAVYVLLWSLFSRTAGMAIVGAIAAITTIQVLAGEPRQTVHWAIQIAFGFILLHSMNWDDVGRPMASTVRRFAAGFWILDSFEWLHSGGEAWMPVLCGGMVLAAYLAIGIYRGRWSRLILPVSAMLVILSGPGDALFRSIASMPRGYLAVMSSFLLLAVGTIAALTKHHWHQEH